MKKLMMMVAAVAASVARADAQTASIDYWDSEAGKMKLADCKIITESSSHLGDDGWYYVNRTVTITHGLNIEGKAHIILRDGANLVIRAGKNVPGIAVCWGVSESDRLYVYGQEKGTGKMEVHGGENAAGIGGICGDDYDRHMGNMYVYGGIIEAYGGKNAAGIGGSYYKNSDDKVYAGDGSEDFYIYGGTVRAYGGEGAAGVGGANGNADPSDLFIYGGLLEATGGNNGGKGIGGGAGQGATCDLKSDYAAVWTDPSPTNAFSIVHDEYKCTTTYVRMIAIHELVTGDTTTFERGKGYLVNSSVSRGTISVDGSAYLFLGKNSELTVYGDSVPGLKMAGLEVSPGNSIEIFGLEGGKLTASGSKYAAGIGGSEGGAGGMVTINGGTVTATGGEDGAGIGGGYGSAGGTVAINGGDVTATGGECGAGIGGGYGSAGGTVTINDGRVTATGGGHGAGIGGGYGSAGGTVTIYDGAVMAKGGIGAADMNGSVSISGGVFGLNPSSSWLAHGYGVIANSDPSYPYAVVPQVTLTVPPIVGASVVVKVNGTVVKNFAGGTLLVTPTSAVTVDYTALDGWSLQGTTHFAATVSGDLRLPAAGSEPTAIRLFTVTVPTVAGTTLEVKTNGTTVAGFSGGRLAVFPGTEVTVDYAALEGWNIQGSTHFEATVSGDLQLPADDAKPFAGHPVAYMKRIVGKDGSVQSVKDYANAAPVTAETERLGNGWYYVVGSFTRSGIDIAAGCTANLILSDDASLTVEGASSYAGVDVCLGETLNIYCQEKGTGVLVAKGGDEGAGIGGGKNGVGGTVTINGGTVNATGGGYGAGMAAAIRALAARSRLTAVRSRRGARMAARASGVAAERRATVRWSLAKTSMSSAVKSAVIMSRSAF